MTTTTVESTTLRKPLPSEVDVFGLTHPGRKRAVNADHFLVASFHRALKVHASSLDGGALPPLSTDSRGYIFLVADGVGGLIHAKDGSAQATDSIARYFLDSSEISLQTNPEREVEVIERLRASVTRAHEALLAFADQSGGAAATTITVWFALWPRGFVVHAGDSRCYQLRDGVLDRLTTDQTMAQVMIDAGAMTREAAEGSRLKHVLVSAVGSSQLDLQVVAFDLGWTDRWLLCSDGLTRHVSDDEIRARLGGPRTAEEICRELLALALERGGEDNITIIAARPRAPVA
jgi:serine/threonine protein phosphatase PrpC